jgi:SAM-dependent methyltransferase
VRRPYLELFLVSFLILFYELAAIRWFASTVIFLSFFTNIVLLACFLGMSVGLLSARRPQSFVASALPLGMLAFAAAVATNLFYWQWAEALTVSLGDQQSSPRLIYFGTEYRPADPSRWIIPMWGVAGAFFTLIALSFIGLGQVMGRAFDAIADRVRAYSVDILGSLTGIAAFAAMSWFELPPTAWFAPIVALMLYFAGWRKPVQLAAALTMMALVAIGAHALKVHGEVFWSPYYKVAFKPYVLPEPRHPTGRLLVGKITTNDMGHQEMMPIGEQATAYLLPHLLNRDAGGAPFEEVMIIGAGSGNDVAAALRAGAKRIDAVEIDPIIQDIGHHLHPDRPYQDKRVSVHLDDGRSFARTTGSKYDLAVYALVDSLVLHSGYSSLRLENFLFTREAFQDVKRTLKPDGVFAMYNYYRQGWVVGRLAKLTEEVFGTPPIVISLPYREAIRADESQADHFTLLLAGTDSKRLQAIRAAFEREGAFWANSVPAFNEPVNAFRNTAPEGNWHRTAPARVDLAGIDLLPSDDWPQLYLRSREIPWSPIGQGMLTVALLACLILLAFTPLKRAAPNWTMFFLGAGFMLLETKGVVHMALLFGATWVVNSVVFAAILVMILCSNLYVMRFQPARLTPYYVLLIVALLVNALVPMNMFLSLPPLARALSSCLVVFVPVFFAGVVFAMTFRQSRQPDVDLGWNVAGIIAGGLSEQLSLVLGFNQLLLVAVAFYLLSLIGASRTSAATTASGHG